jgi:hypothetical protein
MNPRAWESAPHTTADPDANGHHLYYDQVEVLTQLGLMPAPVAAAS